MYVYAKNIAFGIPFHRNVSSFLDFFFLLLVFLGLFLIDWINACWKSTMPKQKWNQLRRIEWRKNERSQNNGMGMEWSGEKKGKSIVPFGFWRAMWEQQSKIVCRLLMHKNGKSGNRHAHAHAWISLSLSLYVYSGVRKKWKWPYSYCLVYGWWWRLNLIVFTYIYFTIFIIHCCCWLSMLVAVIAIPFILCLSSLSHIYLYVWFESWSLVVHIIHSSFSPSTPKRKSPLVSQMLFIQNRILMYICACVCVHARNWYRYRRLRCEQATEEKEKKNYGKK